MTGKVVVLALATLVLLSTYGGVDAECPRCPWESSKMCCFSGGEMSTTTMCNCVRCLGGFPLHEGACVAGHQQAGVEAGAQPFASRIGDVRVAPMPVSAPVQAPHSAKINCACPAVYAPVCCHMIYVPDQEFSIMPNDCFCRCDGGIPIHHGHECRMR